jgi:exopolyphosphatase / guanosine-5'-triphosphate,3'-diphosphate pyrophosphatase
MSRMFSAIDVGTHAARIKLARRSATGSLQVIHQERSAVCPGEGVFKSGRVSSAATERLCETLARFARRGQRLSARVRAVATAPLREAYNSEAVLRRVRDVSGLSLEVISSHEEARLTCLGVLAGSPPERRSVCIDLGGGSTEVVVAHGERPERTWSVPLGSLRLREIAEEISLDQLRHHAWLGVAGLPRGLEDDAPRLALGSSGSLRALVQFAVAGMKAHATLDELARATEELEELGARGRLAAFGQRRADVILPAAVALEAVVRRLKLGGVQAVKRGLRDGLLIEMSRASTAVDEGSLHHAQAIAAPLDGAAHKTV